jgi:hypothetical protein
MSLWLTKRLDLDLATVDGDKGKRVKREEEEHYLIWLHLVPLSSLPSAYDIELVINALFLGGFTLSGENRMYTVFPADIADAEYVFSTVSGIAGQLARQGGGVLFGGRGAGIALLCDPKAVTRRETIRRTGLNDEVAFGEFSIWMPRPEPKGVTHDEAAAAILEILPRIHNSLICPVCFTITTDDLASLAVRWPYHRQFAEAGRLSELFWYQSFWDDLSTELINDYQRAGCTIHAVEDGHVVVQLTELPSVGLTKLEAARDRWLYSLIPRRVC